MNLEILQEIFDFDKGVSPADAREIYTKVSAMIRDELSTLVSGTEPRSKAIDIIRYLRIFSTGTQGLRKKYSTICEMLKKEIRFLCLVLSHYSDNIEKPAKKSESKKLLDTIKELFAQFGVVPRLNETIPLPPEEYLPKRYVITSKKWEKIAWINPGRDNTDEPLYFFSKECNGYTIASVRLYLIDRDGNEDKTMARGYADANFSLIDVGNLHADHLQPSEAIVKRQLEMIEAMNLDQKFKEEMMEIGKTRGYFIEVIESGEKVTRGTKKFYLEYHNCIGNVWFISAAANSGCGKGNMDVIEWLRQDTGFGKRFFDDIGGIDSINKEGILYTTKTGEFLTEVAHKWFKETHGQVIEMTKFFDESIAQRFKRSISETEKCTPRTKKRRLVKGIVAGVTMQAAAKAMEVSDSGSGHSGDISSDDAKPSDENFLRAEAVFESEKKELRAMMKRTKKRYMLEPMHKPLVVFTCSTKP